MTVVLIREEKRHRDRNTGRVSCANRSRDWRDAAASQRTPKTDGHNLKLGKGRERFFPYRFQRKHSLADTLILDFYTSVL